MHFTPLRYPGGKGRLAPFIKRVIEANDLLDGDYVEPYAGGAAIAIELLLQEYVSIVHINDISRPVYSFWTAVLNHTEGLLRLIRDVPLTLTTWDRQKAIYSSQTDHSDLELGFATLFLNRTNRSGIFNAGVIGGRAQTGKWRIDARFNVLDLSRRIELIAGFKNRIHLSGVDAISFLKELLPTLARRSLIYLDPPYYSKGKDLYFDYYTHGDHAAVARLVQRHIRPLRWIVSYDNVTEIRRLYSKSRGIAYGLGYSAREVRSGAEVMFFSDKLFVPAPAGGMRPLIGGARPDRSIGFQPRIAGSIVPNATRREYCE